MNTPDQSPLGKSSAYQSQYAPELLFPIARQQKRDELGLTAEYVVCSNGAVVMRRVGDGWERWRMQDDALEALANAR